MQFNPITNVYAYNTLPKKVEGPVSCPYAGSKRISTILSRSVLMHALMAVLIWPMGVSAAQGNGYEILRDVTRQDGEKVPLCNELLEILNLPENVHTVGLGSENNPIIFPARYKSFKLVKWEPTPLKDVEKYIGKDRLREGMEARKKIALINEDWDGKGTFTFEKARVNFDNAGNIVTMLRYRLPTWKQWSCLLGNDAPPRYFERFNAPFKRGGSYGDSINCTIFTYDGSSYFISNDIQLTVFKPTLHSPYPSEKGAPEWMQHIELYDENLCTIKNPNQLEEFDSYYRKFSKE